jgi:hypothetical protein
MSATSTAASDRLRDVPLVYTAAPDAAAVRQEGVTREELAWCFARRPLVQDVTVDTLALDWGNADAEAMLAAFHADAGLAVFVPLLRWCGVGTRWRQLWQFLTTTSEGARLLTEATEVSKAEPQAREALQRDAFHAFAVSLGRVTTYRALSLDEAAYQRVLQADEIFPTGQLSQSAATLTAIIDTHGIRKVAVARLFIAQLRKLIGHDPSISLHDDWETTTLIASGYLEPRAGAAGGHGQRALYLFEVSVPVLESLGWTLQRVAHEAPEFLGQRYANHEPWFEFPAPAAGKNGPVWFDATLQRTERYGMYTVPHLQQRLRHVWKFTDLAQVTQAVGPFVAAQREKHLRFPLGEGS